jgi:hypothetical protein
MLPEANFYQKRMNAETKELAYGSDAVCTKEYVAYDVINAA